MQPPEYWLTLNGEQAETLADACALWARLKAGELMAAADELQRHGLRSRPAYEEAIEQVRVRLRSLTSLLAGGRKQEGEFRWEDPRVPHAAREAQIVASAIQARRAPERTERVGPFLGIVSPEVRGSADRVEVRLSEGQAQIASEAAELVGRLHMGQAGQIYDLFAWEGGSERIEDLHRAKDVLDHVVGPLITGMSRNASWGISSPEIAERARVAMDLHMVIRHRLAWDRNPQGNRMHVHFDPPYALSRVPLASIETLRVKPVRAPEPSASSARGRSR